MSNFKVGQKVVCVKSAEDKTTVKGKVYEISEISSCSCGQIGLHFIGVPREIRHAQCMYCKRVHFNTEIGNAPYRFRPIQDHYASISSEVLQSLPKQIEESVDVPNTVEA